MKQPKFLKLDMEAMEDRFYDDCRILGIVAPMKDYQLVWQINRVMGMEFRFNNVEIRLHKKRRDYFFAVFEYFVPNTQLKHFIYNNEQDGEYLLPEFKHLDFIWLCRDEMMEDGDLNILMNNIKVIPEVQLISELNINKIKKKQNLLI